VLTAATPPASAAASPPTPVIRGEGAASAIPGSYVVKLKDTASVRSHGVGGRARTLNKAHRGTLGRVWQHALRGFTTTMTRDQALKLAADPDVEYVLQDQLMVSGGRPPTPAPPGLTQSPANWGLDRIDQHARPLDNKYSYDDTAGQAVHAYIVGSGIEASHPDFGGRAFGGGNFVNDGIPSSEDCSGSGTAMAGIVGGHQHGVAKKVTLVGVRMVGCSPLFPLSAAVSGFDWVVDNAVRPAILLYAFDDFCWDGSTPVPCSPEFSATMVELQEAAFHSGITVIGSAGDHAQNTCAISTGAGPNTIYVGATTINDARTGSSNFGPCVTMYAPGEGVTTDDIGGDTGVTTGTYASAAYVAGAAALFMGKPEFVGAHPAQIRAELVTKRSTPNVITGLPSNTPNLLLFTGPPGFLTVGDTAAISLRSDGRMMLFGTNKEGFLFHRQQTTPGSSAWSNWTQSTTKGWLSVGAGANADGRLALLGMTQSGELWVRQEAAPSSNTWSTWSKLSPTTNSVPISRAVMAHNQSNRLQIFVTDHQGKAYYRSQLSPGSALFTTWNGLNFPGTARDITAVPYADGRIEVLALNDAGEIWRTTQTSATDTNWGPFTKLNGFGMASIAAARNASGKLELVGLDAGGGAWHRTQTTVGTWGGWTALSAKTLAQVTAGTNANGRIQIVGVDNLGKIWQSTQTSANSSAYSTWSQIDGTFRP
jgi:hypothetical protein